MYKMVGRQVDVELERIGSTDLQAWLTTVAFVAGDRFNVVDNTAIVIIDFAPRRSNWRFQWQFRREAGTRTSQRVPASSPDRRGGLRTSRFQVTGSAEPLIRTRPLL